MKKLCVVFGGRSPEHDISLKSVTSVLNNLDKSKYEITTLGITKSGAWYIYTGDYAKIIDSSWEKDTANLKKAVISPDAEDKCIIVFENETTVSKLYPDVIFPVLHGEYGEDGTIQGLFELSDIKYVGMGVLSSANGMDKIYSKLVFKDAGIPQADWVVYRNGDDIDEKISEIENKLGYPCFVKPACTGSSVGVGKAHAREELRSAIENAAKFDRKVLIEENIDGHEVETAVLGNFDAEAATVGEIMPTVEFYDFDAKYNDNSTQLQIPAELPAETTEQIRKYAVTAFKALDGQGLSRVDFFVKYSDGSVILNEINTLPGFTDISMYPKLWGAVGLGYGELLDKLIELAEKRVK
ncbi:MAG TPA: D-alanine--D-alanine ligase [Candidatus Ornithomonoglobus intestinigallinarum]|uniref:D-alanine--D-alanine ligase n=1 Tax=Candidatus Ornithomonoglobus intestinigallinarum TaxID=2840894 RepID=A0A9D1H6F2_9FIRM|nr:D-alanine--D-alanine ligase [Candidatus Ornithomonoglobus intestinigallinarum]